MRQSRIVTALALAVAVGTAGTAWAGAPQPDTRSGDFKHICKGGSNKAAACTVANEATDCPKSVCVVKTLSKTFVGKLTIIADDFVVDWAQGIGSPKALTLMLEVKAPDGTKQILAETYQNLTDITQPPELTGNVVSIPADELAVANLAAQVSGLLFVQPESTMADRLRTLFSATGTPVLVGLKGKSELADHHTADDLATVLRFKVKIQFLDPV